MSDDTKALVERARELAGYKYQHHTLHVPAVLNLLADTIERLERDRDARADRCEKLREALRDATIWPHPSPDFRDECMTCGAMWGRGDSESHIPSCLAAPKDAP